MDKEFERQYQEYLNNTLDIAFNEENGVKVNNPWYVEPSMDSIKIDEIELEYQNVDYDRDLEVTIIRNKDGEYNLLDKNGNLVFDKWYETPHYEKSRAFVFRFDDGYACVVTDNGINFIDSKGNLLCEKGFYRAYSFHDGYAVVEVVQGQYTYIDTTGKPISGKRYEDAFDFQEGYAHVIINGKDYFIDTKGNRTFDESFYKDNPNIKYENFSSFIKSGLSDGYAVVSDGKEYNYIDAKGNFLSKKWFSEAHPFSEGLARVKINDKTAFIDKNGVVVSDKWYLPEKIEFIGDFHDGFARVDINKYQNYISKSGKILKKKVRKFKDGKAVVKKDGFFYYINTSGNLTLISPIMNGAVKNYPVFIELEDDHYHKTYYYVDKDGINVNRVFDSYVEVADGIYKVRKDEKYSLLFTHDNSLLGEWYDHINVKGNFAIADADSHLFFINLETKKVTEIANTHRYLGDWNDYSISSCENGYVVVELLEKDFWDNVEKKYNIIDANGKIHFTKWIYASSYILKNGYIIVEKSWKNNNYIMNLDAYYVIPPTKLKNKRKLDVSLNFFKIDGNLLPIKVDMKGLSVEKKAFGYQVSDKTNIFKVKYQPVKNYDNKYFICINKQDVILYNRETNSYQNLGSDVEYDDNFIKVSNTIYLMANGQMIDVTNYYKKNLKNKQEIFVSKDIEVMEPDEFYGENEDIIREKFREALKENERIKEQRKIKEQQEQIEEVKKNDERQQRMMEIRKLEALRHLAESVKTLEDLSNNKSFNSKDRITPYGIIINVNDHYEINPYYIETNVLKYLDLSGVSFKNVKVSGIDFRGCNISFNPQEVYNKDLSNCNFEGVFIHASTDFTGVNICGTKFTSDNNTATFDINLHNFVNAIYDENTTLNGIPIIELIGNKIK